MFKKKTYTDVMVKTFVRIVYQHFMISRPAMFIISNLLAHFSFHALISSFLHSIDIFVLHFPL